MDRKKVKEVRSAIENLLKNIDLSLGVNIEMGSGSYTDTAATFKIEVLDTTASGGASSKLENDWNQNAPMLGFEVSDFGKEFTIRGERFKIAGLKPRSHKFPVIAENSNGKQYKFPAVTVQMALGKPPTTNIFRIGIDHK